MVLHKHALSTHPACNSLESPFSLQATQQYEYIPRNKRPWSFNLLMEDGVCVCAGARVRTGGIRIMHKVFPSATESSFSFQDPHL